MVFGVTVVSSPFVGLVGFEPSIGDSEKSIRLEKLHLHAVVKSVISEEKPFRSGLSSVFYSKF